jgi:hypothetical protein
MKLSHLLHTGIFLLVAAFVIGSSPVLALADDDDHASAEPFTFVGAAGDCGPGYPAGSRIVTARWLKGMGLPDNGGPNVGTNPADNPNKKDPHWGLRIHGVKGMNVTATTALGYDYRNGGHCGAGAPRFNVDTDMGFFFVGCANAPRSPAPQDPLQWTRTRSVLSSCGVECFPGPIPVGAKIKSITIIFDEGTDTANNDTQGVGLAVLDNIFINGTVIGATGNSGDDD